MNADDCCILNTGGGAWAFEALASELSDALWVDVADAPRALNYLLHADDLDSISPGNLFIAHATMTVAADKRELAIVFNEARVPIPESFLVDSLDAAKDIADRDPHREWCIKYPTGCGGSGHRLLTPDLSLTDDWPHPLLVQEFVRQEDPAVFRMYAAGSEIFGWIVRRFPSGTRPSPWVAHARGARYEIPSPASDDAKRAAKLALDATGLTDCFGCVDLIQRPDGEWLVLEVGTDGMYNHVDRSLDLPDSEREIQRRIATAFWSRAESTPPWGEGAWRLRSES